MIKHDVMWKVKGDATEKKIKSQQIKEALESLIPIIKEIHYLEVGINQIYTERSADVILKSTFKSLADLETYQVHPEHKKVVAFIKENVTEAWAVDYE